MDETFNGSNHEAPIGPPTVDQAIALGLDNFESHLNASVAALQEKPGAYSLINMPQGFMSRPDDETRVALATQQYDVGLLYRYIDLQNRTYQLLRPMGGLYSIMDIEHSIGSERIQAIFASETDGGVLHEVVAKELKRKFEAKEGSKDVITFLQKAKGYERPIDLLSSAQKGSFDEQIRDSLLTSPGLSSLFYMEVGSKRPIRELGDNFSLDEFEQDKLKTREWMADVLMRATGLKDEDLADSYVYGASRKDDENAVSHLLPDIIHKIETLGETKLAKLRDFAGIYALSDYRLKQLELMVKVADGNHDELKRLKKQDVNVVIANKMGDHNNILSAGPAVVDDAHERTLFFEVQSAADVYRVMRKLRQRGIKPSTLFVAAHGSPGQIAILPKPDRHSTKRIDVLSISTPLFVAHKNKTEAPYYGRALHNMLGFKRLVDEYMQPSRTIDDAAETKGRKKIIFSACNAATRADFSDYNADTGEASTVGQTSIIDQLADDLLAREIESRVELYGADIGLQIARTKQGLIYTQQSNGFSFDRPHYPATKISIDDGSKTKSKVDEVPLRHFDD